MDFVKNALGGDGNNNNNQNQNQNQQGSSSGGEQKEGGGGGFLSGIGDKINGAAGGGKEVNISSLPLTHSELIADDLQSEKNEDYLDKGIDFAQEKFMGGGPQDNESAVEQAKDEQISDFIRGQYKSTTGSDMPIKDKPTSLDRNTD